MTAQIHDTLDFRGARHLLVGVDGYSLFDPTAHGLEAHLDPRRSRGR